MKKKTYIPFVAAAGLVASLAAVVPAFAQTSVSVNAGVAGVNVRGGIHDGANGGMRRPGMGMGVFGTVTSINGTTLTVTRTAMKPMPEMENGSDEATSSATVTPTVYTVDASNATVYKANATSTFSAIATGDTVMVEGTITGTNVVATVIRDGVMFKGGPIRGRGGFGNGTSTTSTMPASPIKGNGEPIVGGNITAISGNTLTITNASNVTYTIDATNAAIVKKNATTTLSSVAVGDSVVVQGTVNGNAIVATSVVDSGVKENATSTNPGNGGGFSFGFFGAIGGFFKHLFGF